MEEALVKQKIKMIIESYIIKLNTNFVKKEDVSAFVDVIIVNTNSETGRDPFWEKSEKLLLESIMFYILEERVKSEIELSMVMDLLQMEELKVDELFIRMEKEKTNHIAVTQYNLFKIATIKMTKAVFISARLRLAALNELVF